MTAIVPHKNRKLWIVEAAASISDALVCRKTGEAVGRCAEVDVGATQESAGVGDGPVVDFLEALRYCCAEFAGYLSGEIAGCGIAIVCLDVDEDVDGGCATDGEGASRCAESSY
jgi:hypothetical protein